jgi:Potential Queuosine, Q, salvage protein family
MGAARPTALYDEVRRHCAAIAGSARWVTIDVRAGTPSAGVAGLDAGLHLLDAAPEHVARYVLVLDAINFGSGWFPTLRHPAGESPTTTITRRLTQHARDRGEPWTAAELRALGAAELAEVLDQPAGHPLLEHYATALHQLGAWLGERPALEAIEAAGGTADELARTLAAAMPYFEDPGFYKRAQITANDLVLAGVVAYPDIDALTVFADNLLPHVLRVDGVLSYLPELAALVDAGRPLVAGGAMEREIRACAVHACELLSARLGVPPRTLDNWLWNRGQSPPYSDRPPHLTYTVAY